MRLNYDLSKYTVIHAANFIKKCFKMFVQVPANINGGTISNKDVSVNNKQI